MGSNGICVKISLRVVKQLICLKVFFSMLIFMSFIDWNYTYSYYHMNFSVLFSYFYSVWLYNLKTASSRKHLMKYTKKYYSQQFLYFFFTMCCFWTVVTGKKCWIIYSKDTKKHIKNYHFKETFFFCIQFQFIQWIKFVRLHCCWNVSKETCFLFVVNNFNEITFLVWGFMFMKSRFRHNFFAFLFSYFIARICDLNSSWPWL